MNELKSREKLLQETTTEKFIDIINFLRKNFVATNNFNKVLLSMKEFVETHPEHDETIGDLLLKSGVDLHSLEDTKFEDHQVKNQ